MTMMRLMRLPRLLLLVLSLMRYGISVKQPLESNDVVEYGVDVSYPMQHLNVSTNYPWLPHNLNPNSNGDIQPPPEFKGMPLQPLGNRQQFYEGIINSCVEYFNKKKEGQGQLCYENEIGRIEMGLRQPQSMQNYTKLGFAKIRTPDKVFNLIREFWEKNKDRAEPEEWSAGETITNHWQSPTGFVGLEDSNLRGGGVVLLSKIWDAAQKTIEEWTGQELEGCSLYGIRVYYEGSILATHVDRLPLVSSAIIQVDQDVDEPWPLEVISHDGKAHNVTMVPGDMVLYESHSVLHGRPFPLKGRFVANVFVHFEPTGHTLRHDASMTESRRRDKQGKRRMDDKTGDKPKTDTVASYIIPGSPEDRYRKEGGKVRKVDMDRTRGSTLAHIAAQMNDLDALQYAIDEKRAIMHAQDENGWTPLHEGASAGHIDIVKFLLENGADKNAITKNGASVLWWAETVGGTDHPVAELLRSWGADKIDPDPEL